MWLVVIGSLLAASEAPPEMVLIPEGAFLRGSDDGPKNERPRETVELSAFYMDVYEVTVAKFDACVSAKACEPAKTNYSDYSRPQQPKVGVSWFAAVAFCKAQGKHLPTEAEWERAARGVDGRTFPWGEEPATCDRAVIMNAEGQRSCGVEKLHGHPEKGRTLEVGSRPSTPPGLYDMAGNSWEWVYDWASPSYAACGEACKGRDPRGPCGGAPSCSGHSERVVRGGSWYWPAAQATTTYRRFHAPSNRPYHHFGFRCAATLAEAGRLSSARGE